MPNGEEEHVEKSTLAMKPEKRVFNYLILALLTAVIAGWIMWYPK